jgi:hypothetical protein
MGDSEVGHQRVAFAEQNVLGLYVAVDDAVAVGAVECVGYFGRDSECIVQRELSLAAEPSAETLALHVRHGKPELTGYLAGVVDRKDVGMLQAGGQFDLAHEALGSQRVRELWMKQLQRDGSIVTEIAGQVDCRHAPASQLAFDKISAGQSG